MIGTFKNIEPLQTNQITKNYEIISKNGNNCMVFFSGIYCFEGTETQCLDYVKSQPKPKQRATVKFHAKKQIEIFEQPKIEKPKKEIKNIVKPLIQLSLF
jgi:hypothetical protein